VIDPPAAGAWNMAVDELLWQWSAEAGRPCWRFYRWKEPTLSLGYFQAYADRRRHVASRNCPVVRRPSGGGAIVHDAELTYSFALPSEHPLAGRPVRLYETVHVTLVDVLADRGIAAALCGQSEGPIPGRQPFLCFRRRSPGDVLVGEVKIAGSAQRRSKQAVLQHGSVLLACSPAAPELMGLSDLAGGAFEADQLVEAWLEKLRRRLALRWTDEPLGDHDRRRADALVQAKYGRPDWTVHRRRPSTRRAT